MVRRVFTFFVLAVSTLLLLAVVCDWVHSIKNSETLVLIRGPRVYAIDNFDGQVSFWAADLTVDAQSQLSDGWQLVHWDWPHTQRAQDFGVINPAGEDLWFAGFGLTSKRRFPTRIEPVYQDGMINNVGLVVPLWFLTLAFAVVPVAGVWRFRRRARREAEGLCRGCGYDLRASADRCPECGRPFTRAGGIYGRVADDTKAADGKIRTPW